MANPIAKKEILKIVLPPILAVSLFVFTLFGLILPNYKTDLMDQQKRMLTEMTHVAWQMIAVAEEQERTSSVACETAQDMVLDHLRGMRYGKDGLDYFWVNDMRPYMLMHPYRTDLEGTDVSGFRDPQGKAIFKEIVEIAEKSGKGFSTYMWQWKDDPTRMEQKLSYIEYFAPWGWVVGTGIYLDEVNRHIADLSRKLVMISSFIIFIVSVLTYRTTVRALQTAKSQMQAEGELKKHQRYLEKLVADRTADLTLSNKKLQDEVCERKKLEENLYQVAITDELTGLYNRRGFFELAEKQLQLTDRQKNNLCLLFMDLNDLKEINDQFGHETGDYALVETAEILKKFFRKADILSRLGGDEFAVLMVGKEDEVDERAIISRFQEHLEHINSQADRAYELWISTGAVRYVYDAPCSVEDLLAQADALMYEQKRKQKSEHTK